MGSPYKRLSSGGELTPRIPGNLRHSTSYSGGGVTGQLSLQMAAAAAVAATDSSSYIPHSRSYGHFGGGVLAGSGIGGRASGGGGGHLPYGRSATWAAGPPSPQFSPSSCAHSLSGNWVVSSPTTGRPPSHLLGDGNDVFHLSGEHTPLGTSPLPPPPSYTEVMRQSHVYALNRTSVGIPEDSAVTDNSPPRDPRRNPRVLQAAPRRSPARRSSPTTPRCRTPETTTTQCSGQSSPTTPRGRTPETTTQCSCRPSPTTRKRLSQERTRVPLAPPSSRRCFHRISSSPTGCNFSSKGFLRKQGIVPRNG